MLVVNEDRDQGTLIEVLEKLQPLLQSASHVLRSVADAGPASAATAIQPVDGSALQQASGYFHQAGAELEKVGLAASVKVALALESVTEKMAQDGTLCQAEALATAQRAATALMQYLQCLARGDAVSALMLFADYRDLLALVGALRIHPADLWPFDFAWRDAELPMVSAVRQSDLASRIRMEELVLQLIESGAPVPAQSLRDLSLGHAAAQSSTRARIFWKISAAFFELLSIDPGRCDVYGKRAVAGIFKQARALQGGDPMVSSRLVQDLLFFCAQAKPALSANAPVLTAIRSAYGMGDVAACDYGKHWSDHCQGQLDESMKVIDGLRVGITRYNLFLNQADEWSRRLLTELGEWSLELHRRLPDSLVALAQSLAQGAGEIGFHAVAEMAQLLVDAMRQAQCQSPGNPQQAHQFVLVAEDLRRLLHQFAAGFLKPADENLLAGLRARPSSMRHSPLK